MADSDSQSDLQPTSDQPAESDVTASDKAKQHVAKILDEALEEPSVAERSFKHPLFLDFILGIGLLVAVGGFMLGIMNIWIAHQAKECIMQKNYKSAITMLNGLPFKGFFTIPGSDSSELMSQAMYQDAMEKLDANGADASAISELNKIPAGSAFFDNAQDVVHEHWISADTQLQGKAEATPAEAVEPKKPLMPPETDTDSAH